MRKNKNVMQNALIHSGVVKGKKFYAYFVMNIAASKMVVIVKNV